MDSDLRRKIEHIIGEIKEITMLAEQGCTSEVRKIETYEGTYLLKSSFKERYREWLKQESEVLKILKNENNIPVPKYYSYIEDQDSNHLIMSFENGISLTTALKKANNIEEKKLLLQSFGQLLHQLHETKLIHELGKNDDWLSHQLKKAEQYLKMGDLDGTEELLIQLKKTIPESVKQTMIHGDCTTDNVLVINGVASMFIDVSAMTVGDPRYDVSLAIRKFIDNEEFINAFYTGYTRYKVTNEEHMFNVGLYEFF